MAAMNATTQTLDGRQWRQIAGITVGAIVLFGFFRFLPTGTNLNHMDFRVDAKNAIEFCDPLNPQFIPVVAVTSPVKMTLASSLPPAAGTPANFTLTLQTSRGKGIEPVDLLVSHTKLLHLLVIDPTLTDYQHVHPEAGKAPGEWTFTFTPRNAGMYRIFADFTPAATARGLYASADVAIAAASAAGAETAKAIASTPAFTPAPPAMRVELEGYQFELVTASGGGIRAGKPTDLKFSVRRADDGVVPLQPVMGAFAHLVAFDAARSGFAHLHPMETDLLKPPDGNRPTLNFKVTIPTEGNYVIWSQVNLGGRELFVPFQFEVGR